MDDEADGQLPGEQMSKIQARARVQVMLEVEASLWGDDCTVGQVHKQAADDALATVRKIIEANKSKAVIVGTPKVTGVLTENTNQ
jgi:hypothetical protein